MVDREEILEIIRSKGPVLPVQVSKEIETSILFASAMLSEIVSANLLKISHVKIGGSPLYYLPEQRDRLQEFSKHLHQKEKEAYELLKQKKVLKEAEQEPAIKVALRNIKDYAWPLQVTINDNKELFWKWYLLPNEEAKGIIKGILGITEKKPEEKAEGTQGTVEKPEEKREEIKEEKKEGVEEAKERVIEEKAETKTKTQQKTMPEKEIQQEQGKNFLWQTLNFFSQNNIKVLNKEIIKKNEVDFIVELQSAVGGLRYYCRAKSKKKIGDGDLSSAYVQGQLRKLPVMFLSCGEPTKRAKEMLDKEFKNIVFKKI